MDIRKVEKVLVDLEVTSPPYHPDEILVKMRDICGPGIIPLICNHYLGNFDSRDYLSVRNNTLGLLMTDSQARLRIPSELPLKQVARRVMEMKKSDILGKELFDYAAHVLFWHGSRPDLVQVLRNKTEFSDVSNKFLYVLGESNSSEGVDKLYTGINPMDILRSFHKK